MNVTSTTLDHMRVLGLDVKPYAVGYDSVYGVVPHEVYSPYDNSILLVDEYTRQEFFLSRGADELERLARACGGKATRVDSCFSIRTQYVYSFDDAWACDRFIKEASA